MKIKILFLCSYAMLLAACSGQLSLNEGLKISELVVRSADKEYLDGADWIEIKNVGTINEQLSDYAIALGDGDKINLSSAVLKPGEYIVISATAKGQEYTPSVPFSLKKSGQLNLYLGERLQDSLTWLEGEVKRGRSFGRVDGRELALYPTPGTANVPYVLFSDSEVFTVKIHVSEEDWLDILNNGIKETYYPADLTFNGAHILNIGVRTKGQSSKRAVYRLLKSERSSARYSFKLDFNQYKEQKFMGMKHLMLNNGFGDPSLMRDLVAYKLMKIVGMPAPELSFVDLWVRDKHMGLYQLVEAIDGEFIERYFPDDGLNKGDLYKPGTGTTLLWTQGGGGEGYKKLDLKTNEETLDTAEEGKALLAFLESSNNGSAKHIDIDHMLRYIAASALISNLDSYFTPSAQNYYLYEHRSIQAFTLLPWDYNLAFGGLTYSQGGCDASQYLIASPTSVPLAQRPIVARALEQDALKSVYYGYIEKIITELYNPDDMLLFLTQYRGLIDSYVKGDPTSFYSYEEWQRSLTDSIPDDRTFFGKPLGLMAFINKRYASVRKQLSGEAPSTNDGLSPCPQSRADM